MDIFFLTMDALCTAQLWVILLKILLKLWIAFICLKKACHMILKFTWLDRKNNGEESG